MAQIEIDNLSFTYSGSKSKALKNINLQIDKGELCLMIGKSGSGKSTLLNLLMKNKSVYGSIEGKIKIDAKNTAIINQYVESNIINDTVFGELSFFPSNLGYEREKILCKIAETANYFNLTDYIDSKTYELSGGEKQILSLASVMSSDPDVLLLDEPTSQLDPVSAELFINTILKLNREMGITVIIIEHRADALMGIADKIIMVEDGKLKFSLPAQEAAEQLIKENNEMKDILPSYCQLLPNHPISFAKAKETEEKIKYREIFQNTEKTKIGLKAKNIFFYYVKGKNILSFLNFSAYAGKINVIVGANGVGKTTLLKCLASVLKCQSGSVKCTGKTFYLPQNIKTLFLEDKVSDEAENDEELLKMFNLEDLREQSPFDLSIGEQQRLALLKAVKSKAEILILDEPTKGIDVVFKSQLSDMLCALASEGKTIIMAVHDLEFAADTGDYISLLFDHEITYTDSVHNFFSSFSMYTTALTRLTQGRIVSKREAEVVE